MSKLALSSTTSSRTSTLNKFQETVNWLYNQLPVYQRSGGANYKIDLSKTHALMEHLGHPEKRFKSIHVAGTNGKGSVSHMLASIFQEAGYKVGLYTSPHLRDFRERVKINGVMISKEEVIEFVDTHKSAFQALELSFFEMTVGLAFDCFVNHQVDIAIVEVGMGGRLDSTNVITPEVSVITNIGLDHQAFLGNDIATIAGEKAGIIKPGIPVVIGQRQVETTPVFLKAAAQNDAPILWADEAIRTNYSTDLKGEYQVHNVRTAVAAVHQQELFEIEETHVKAGLRNVVENTGLLGRWQILSTNPLTICDTGHNADGIRFIINQLENTPHEHLHLVWGMVNDKDIDSVLRMLPTKATYYFCKPDIPRGLDAETLHSAAKKIGLQGKAHTSVKNALIAAKAIAGKEDLIFVGGSTFVVAEVV
ncbi:bifunctional folylpolyglutamate synthase/dihydrofolate synthase [Phaeocystidibacter luteus]|uniref:Dihydrofolate synthase/folylpolyglutamate synthase n=1 Tax=Phaeocystidibacter luteus TaxID=911197 RepID=A0A6N6RL32_9FLAO|nr:folylpolyglutamate synthase/dihydrofolate synthase family protein [Phaeocystidibacter luteus]KAB2810252.1 bifunctional folylpolyglutamate synthase/dihydrofolate synthase [Phaeocystidibacter luteus]